MTEQLRDFAMQIRAGRQCPASVLIVNYNGSSLLSDCLKSLTACTGEKREIVVVENGSTDDSVGVLARFPRVKVVHSGRNLGFAGGNNLGLRECQGDYVLLLNNDTIVTPGFL